MSRKSSAIEEAIAFSSKVPTFTFEDTAERCYRDVIDVLLDHGWKRVPYRRRSKVEQRRLPNTQAPKLVWTLNEKDVDFSDLLPGQLCNHFEGIHHLTRKQGLCDLLRDGAHWLSHDSYRLVPRNYNLGDPCQREEFIDDYRLSAAVNVLKVYLLSRYAEILKRDWPQEIAFSSSSTTSSSNVQRILSDSLWAVIWYLRINYYGEWPGVDISKHFKDREEALQEEEWRGIVSFSQRLSASLSLPDDYLASLEVFSLRPFTSAEKASIFQTFRPFDYRVASALRLFGKCSAQAVMEGFRNIWVVKSPDSSCGKGIRLVSSLQEALALEQRMAGRVAQKYIETPLLHREKKFDLRVWVAITSYLPPSRSQEGGRCMSAWVYATVYGRRCRAVYRGRQDVINSLNDDAVHLTNYSVQRKVITEEEGSCGNRGGGDDEEREGITSGGGGGGEEELLLGQVELEDLLQRVCEERLQRGEHFLFSPPLQAAILHHLSPSSSSSSSCPPQHRFHLWRHFLWPRIKEKIEAVLEIAQLKVLPRAGSFEFLGFDVLIDSSLEAWLLEVNMSPAMAHRNARQSQLIRRMSQQLVALTIRSQLDEPFLTFWDQQTKIRRQQEQQLEKGPQEEVGGGGGGVGGSSGSGSGGGECWEELFSRPDSSSSSSSLGQSAPPPPPAAAAVAPSPINRNGSVVARKDWIVLHSLGSDNTSVPLGRPRTSSGLAATSSISEGHCEGGGGGGIDVHTFCLQGRRLEARQVECLDQLVAGYEALRRLQAWARLMLERVRRYHTLRYTSAVVLQAVTRRWLACRLAKHLHTERASLLLQTAARRFLAVRALLRLKRCRAASRLQRTVRCYLKRRGSASLTVTRWWRRRRLLYYYRALRKVVLGMRCASRVRRQCASRVYHLLLLHYLRRRSATRRMQRAWRRCLARRQLQVSLAKERRRPMLAVVARVAWERLERGEMLEEDQLSRSAAAAVALLPCYPPQASPLEELLAGGEEVKDITEEAEQEEEEGMDGYDSLLCEPVQVVTAEDILSLPLLPAAALLLPPWHCTRDAHSEEVPEEALHEEVEQQQQEEEEEEEAVWEASRLHSERLLAKRPSLHTTSYRSTWESVLSSRCMTMPEEEEEGVAGMHWFVPREDVPPPRIPPPRSPPRPSSYSYLASPVAPATSSAGVGLEDFFAQTFLRSPSSPTAPAPPARRPRPSSSYASAANAIATPAAGDARVASSSSRARGNARTKKVADEPAAATLRPHSRARPSSANTTGSSSSKARASSRSVGKNKSKIKSGGGGGERRMRSSDVDLPDPYLRELYQLYL